MFCFFASLLIIFEKEFLSKKQSVVNNTTNFSTVSTNIPATTNTPSSNNNTNTTTTTSFDSIAQSTAEPVYHSKEDAIKAFRSLLDEKIDVSKEGEAKDWIFVMKKIANDERYKAIKNVNEKKAIFLDFVDMKKHQEREERRQRTKRVKEEFMELLSEIKNPEFVVTSSSSFRKLLPFLEQDSRFQNLSKETDRLDFLYWFDEYQKTLEVKEKKEQEQKKRSVLEAFRLLLIRKVEQGKINHQTLWKKIQEEIEETPEYKELDKVERFSVWDSFIREIQRIEDEKREKEREKKRKQEIRNRAALWKLLVQMHKNGEINVMTQWREFKSKIAENDIYKTVEQQPGPKPRHLFDEFLDDLEVKFQMDKKVMKTILKEHNISIELETPYQMVLDTISQDLRFNTIDASNVRVYYDDSIQKAKEKLEHKRKKNIDKLKGLFKETPTITLSTTFEQCKSLLEGKPELEALTEPDRLMAFEAYISKLRRKEERRNAKRKRDEVVNMEDNKKQKSNEGEAITQSTLGVSNSQDEEEDEFDRELQFLARRKEQILSHLQLTTKANIKPPPQQVAATTPAADNQTNTNGSTTVEATTPVIKQEDQDQQKPMEDNVQTEVKMEDQV